MSDLGKNGIRDFYDEEEEAYRDHIATVDKDGKRIWLYPKKPFGPFYNWRSYLSYFYLIIFFVMPFIKVNGHPFLMLNILERKFVILGIVFYPQDFHLFLMAMLTFLVSIILFTVVFGRIFCGWVCPQTIFMEMVFRKIEYWIEGDANSQRKLNATSWNADKIKKKLAKHAIFFGLAVLISNTFLAYIVGIEEVIRIVTDPIQLHIVGFIAMLVFSFVFYGVFAWMREQVCTSICPYGRLQGVLLDKNSIVIMYDWIRGEPRGKLKKAETNNTYMALPVLGDCIDCKLCVHVCPTGIDIRNGTQLECVNCTACIDACDQVMDKIGKPKGLIRYDSFTGVESKVRKIFTARSITYSIILVILLLVNVGLWVNRAEVEATVQRSGGQLYQMVGDSVVTNLYNFQLLNKTPNLYQVKIESDFPKVEIQHIGNQNLELMQESQLKGSFFVRVPREGLSEKKTKITLQFIDQNGEELDRIQTYFFGPNPK